jgi:hypothetical protein
MVVVLLYMCEYEKRMGGHACTYIQSTHTHKGTHPPDAVFHRPQHVGRSVVVVHRHQLHPHLAPAVI